MSLKILYIAEIVGKAGVWCVKTALPHIKTKEKPDLIIANADGTTGGWGLGRQHAGYLRKLGIDIITGGDCIFYKKDLVEGLERLPYVLRPVNYPAEAPGRGWKFFTVKNYSVAVVSMLGRASFTRNHADNPFTCLRNLSEQLLQESPFIIVDFHASATAEKQAFFYFADGRVSAVIGSHTRVQTADERILEKGTGIVTDAGRTGSINSISGLEPKSKMQEYLSRVPQWSKETWENLMLQGIILELDNTGKTISIRRIQQSCKKLQNQL